MSNMKKRIVAVILIVALLASLIVINVSAIEYVPMPDDLDLPRTMAAVYELYEQEQITVDVYIYFDGTDADAKNSIVAGELLNGQTVEIKFGINELSYNPQIEPSVE